MAPSTSGTTALSSPAAVTRSVAATLLPVLGIAVATYSVVRFRPWIVLTYLILAGLLAALVVSRRPWPASSRLAPALGLLMASALTWVPTWSYLPEGRLNVARGALSIAAAICAALILVAGRSPLTRRTAHRIVLGTALAAHLGVTALVIREDPAPSIDVWYTLQGAADAFADGRSWYSEIWVAPPGVMNAFTYLPWTVVLLAPFRWFFGDVRWGVGCAGAIAALAIASLPITRGVAQRAMGTTGGAQVAEIRLVLSGYAALVLLLPGTTTQLEQAWTEPVLLACLSTAVWFWLRQRPVAAAVCLAIGLGSKQHLVLLLPLLAAWPRIGVRRTVQLGLMAAVAVSPWLLSDGRAFIMDTVTVLVRYPPMRFANTVYILALNETGVMAPFWITGVVLIASIASLAWLLRHRASSMARLLGGCALVLLVANLVNKQAFYNQYWLVATMALLALAVGATEASARGSDSAAVPVPVTSESHQ